MKTSDHAPLIALAMMASRADGQTGSDEQRAVDEVVARIGNPDVSRLAAQVASGQLRVTDVASRLSDDEARRTAWEGALAIVNADGVATPAEQAFLEELRAALGLSEAEAARAGEAAAALAGAPVPEVHAGPLPPEPVDDLIVGQAMLTAALEILPERLASIAILPIQLRLVFNIGRRHGQALDFNQAKDLAAALGIGVAAQSVQGAALKLIGGLAGSLLGGLGAGAARIAGGAVMTFSTTYALGHVAETWYRQGRRLDVADLRQLFARFQGEARALYPKVEERVRQQAASLNLDSLLQRVGVG